MSTHPRPPPPYAHVTSTAEPRLYHAASNSFRPAATVTSVCTQPHLMLSPPWACAPWAVVFAVATFFEHEFEKRQAALKGPDSVRSSLVRATWARVGE